MFVSCPVHLVDSRTPPSHVTNQNPMGMQVLSTCMHDELVLAKMITYAS